MWTVIDFIKSDIPSQYGIYISNRNTAKHNDNNKIYIITEGCFYLKTLLYITASTKPEEISTSKQTGRNLVNRFLAQNPDYELEELDLNTASIPEINHKYFEGRVQLVSGPAYDNLTDQDKDSVDKINALCDQFLNADTYIIAAPMWSMSFPAKLKQYLDCIMLNNKVIKLTPKEATGLLGDKERKMVYIQSSGGIYPKIIDFKFNYGVNYFKDLFKHLGVSEFYKILVQGTDMVDVGKDKAIAATAEDIDYVLDKLSS